MMLTLIFVFGVWINPVKIEYMDYIAPHCYVYMTGHRRIFKDTLCIDIIKEINTRLQETSDERIRFG